MTADQTSPKTVKTACILCSINCGLEVEIGGADEPQMKKIKGDKAHVSSQGYVCNKAARLNHYQMGADRLTSPMKRQPDGTYLPVDWDTAIREVAAGLNRVQTAHGGDKIYFIGGGGQGNHLGGLYASALIAGLGVKFQTNALAQEKTGEFWVSGKMFGGGGPHGDFEHAEVAVFLGKNPWQAHGFPQTRKVLNAIAKNPERTMIVIDPALTDTAKMADFHLRLKPGTDAWCLTAMIAFLIQNSLYDTDFVNDHTEGFDAIKSHFEAVDIAACCRVCDLDEELVGKAAKRIGESCATSIFEDLGIQQNVNSTLVSYLQRILWVITGNFGKEGGHNIPVALLSITDAAKQGASGRASKRSAKVSPVLGSKVITGLLPCNEVPDEILTDHPDRFRAAVIVSSNPVHSYADSPRMREAMDALEFSVVIDIAMTETARCADYVLPASSQFEKHECTFFSVEFPRNHFHLRQPILPPLSGTLTEAEICTRLVEKLGLLPEEQIESLRRAAESGRIELASAMLELMAASPETTKLLPMLLYRSLGPTLDEGRNAIAAPFWALAHQFAQTKKTYAERAGFQGSEWDIGEAIFSAILDEPSGFVFGDAGDYSDSWNRIGYPDKRIRLFIAELFEQAQNLDESILTLDPGFPLVLAAGNRRATTSNTIIRDASWDKRGDAPSLFVHPVDAESLGLEDGDLANLETPSGNVRVTVAVSEEPRPGSISLPNGFGLDYANSDGTSVRVGAAPNELTESHRKDFFAGTPWHKYVPARLSLAASRQEPH